jgi:3-deoxy-D-manno-octulosonic-acid transferase
MFKMIKRNSIPLLLMNARITSRSFNRWNFFNKFSKNIFQNIYCSYPQNLETKKFLKKLKVNNINKIGNLKFCETKELKKDILQKSFLKSIKNRLIFCASSTHAGEEYQIAKAHLILKKKYKNLLTIIIPRHVERIREIYNDLSSLDLKTIIRTSNKKINSNTDIYLVDTYGETKKFFNISKIAFIGGSIINHGGQNPIEPARFGLNILHGPNIQNFKDIYQFFNRSKIAYKFNNLKQLIAISDKLLILKKNKKINLMKMGKLILRKNLNEINKIFNNELKKT